MRAPDPTEAQLLDMLDGIYGAASDLSRWPGVLQAASETLGNIPIAVFAGGADASARQPILVTSGFREDLARDYEEHPERWPDDPYATLVRDHPNRLIDTRAFLDDADVMATDFYQRWSRPQGLGTRAIGSFWLPSDDGPGAGTVFCQPERMEDFSSQQLRLIERLDQHFVRSARTLALLERTRSERDSFLDALDGLARGVLLIDGERRVMAVNRAADDILRDADGLALRNHVLSAANPDETRELLHQIGRVVADDSIAPALLVSRPSGARPYQVVVTPLRQHLNGTGSFRFSSAAVFVTDPERRQRPVEEVLASLYGLTHSEARVAAALGSGVSIREYAERRERSRETVRSLLKRVFAKTGVRRQAELAALVTQGLAGLRIEGSGDAD